MRDAFNIVNQETNDMSLIQLSAIGRQVKIDNIWHKHCWPWEWCIVKAPYGQPIKIVCQNCGAIGTTKNIDYVGARTLFIDCCCDAELKTVAGLIGNEENLTNNVV